MDEARARAEAAVRQAMAATGLSQSALARAAGMSPSTLTRFMSGKAKSVLTLVTLAKIHKVVARYGGASGADQPPHDPTEDILLGAFRDLSEGDQKALLEYLDLLILRRARGKGEDDRTAG